jgi:hypothetical protein
MEAFYCVHHSAFPRYVNYIHYVFHCAHGMFPVYRMLSEFWFIVVVFKVSEVFLISDSKWSSCLSRIFHFAFWAR